MTTPQLGQVDYRPASGNVFHAQQLRQREAVEGSPPSPAVTSDGLRYAYTRRRRPGFLSGTKSTKATPIPSLLTAHAMMIMQEHQEEIQMTTHTQPSNPLHLTPPLHARSLTNQGRSSLRCPQRNAANAETCPLQMQTQTQALLSRHRRARPLSPQRRRCYLPYRPFPRQHPRIRP